MNEAKLAYFVTILLAFAHRSTHKSSEIYRQVGMVKQAIKTIIMHLRAIF